MKTAYLSSPACARHDMGDLHPESARRVSVIADRLILKGLIDLLECHDAPLATIEQIERAHDALYVSELMARAPQQGYLAIDPDTLMNPFTIEAALRAAGAAIKATELVASGQVRRAFCNVRPPGHHATRSQAMGFCFFNNVAIAMRHGLSALGLERVALVDFDVHHGNGSEDILAGDERVLMVSTFQTRLYPFSGETPLGSNMLNVPLSPYSGGQALREAVIQRWIPALEAFGPQLIFVSAGFDAHRDDEMGQLGWSDADYGWLSAQIVEASERLCQGRVVSVLEGGYDLPSLARCAELHVRALLGIG